MSRSFGDEEGHRVRVVIEPEILENFLNKEDKFIVLGSDDIWEFISSKEVVDIVKDQYIKNDFDSAIEHLYNEEAKRWIIEQEIVDDIIVIVIFLS